MVVWSALAHAGALGFLLVSPGDRDHEPPRVISIELVEPAPAAAPREAPQAAPAPPPEAAPEPPPPPEPPKPKTVVLPENPTAPKPPPKEKPKPKPKPREEVFKEPPKTQEKNLDELLAEMRGTGEKAPTPTSGEAVDAAVAPSPGPSEGSGDPLSPEEMAWHARVKRKMKGIWIVPPGFRTQALVTRVVVSLDASGNIQGDPRITQKSGNPWYDESVIRGLTKASPLPPPPEAGDWPMQFEPGDSL
jgi:periplasmic protein TonB